MSAVRESKGVSRRAFLVGAAASASALAVGGVLSGVPEAIARKGGGGKPRPSTRNPLYIPPTAAPSGYALTAQPAVVDIGGGNMSSVWAYNGLLPGATLVASRGDTATLSLYNRLSQPTITHWHGMIVDDLNDGAPRLAIPSLATYNYNFAIDQRAALNWYHPHPHGLTGEQVAMGLAGAFIVRDAEEDALSLPSGVYEVPLILRDASFDKKGNMKYTPKNGGFEGKVPLVNGTLNPKLEVDTARYRFRVLAGSNARIFGLALSNGAPFGLIGNDGGLLEASVSATQIDLSPGERADVIVDFRGLAVGDTVMLRDLRSDWDLLEFVVVRKVNDPSATPTTLSNITPLPSPVRTRDFSFDGMSKINGLEYDLDRIDFQVPFGETELWRFTTKGNAPHPVHVHGVPFQIVSRTGGRGQIFPWELGWKDTVLLEDQETVEVLIRFDAFRSLYVMHCHKLEHEDAGMMANFEVV
jgi:FtsP/CotA-like multicopper oxidase with cupredoxin domain